ARTRLNYFGRTIGWPILKNKLFFYFNYQQLVNPFNSISTISVPTDAMKAGCFDPGVFGNSLTLDAAHGGTPLTANAAQCGVFNPADLAIPTSDFDPVAVNIQNNYVRATNQNLVQNNYTFLSSGTNNSKKTLGRLGCAGEAGQRVSGQVGIKVLNRG